MSTVHFNVNFSISVLTLSHFNVFYVFSVLFLKSNNKKFTVSMLVSMYFGFLSTTVPHKNLLHLIHGSNRLIFKMGAALVSINPKQIDYE